MMNRWIRTLVAAVVALGVVHVMGIADAADPNVARISPKVPGEQTIVLAGGCFWGLEGVFERVRGVTSVMSGYAGGAAATAHYDIVSTGTTGHAESVEISYDPRVISTAKLLDVYFTVATDPTQLNEQYPDDGSQYRGDIFYTTDAQRDVALATIKRLTAEKRFAKPIVTKVDRLPAFYAAEGYHQRYLDHHPESGYIQQFDMPKIAALRAKFPTLVAKN